MTRAARVGDRLLLPEGRLPRVLIVGDPAKLVTAELAERVRKHLPGRAELLGVELERTLRPFRCEPDLLVVIGGDGALLAATRRLGACRAPVLGVNVGTVGFLAGVAPPRVLAVLDLVLAGQGVVEERGMLAYRVSRGGALGEEAHVLNDVVVGRAPERGMCEVGLIDEGRSVTTYRGDGVIVSTATGSTAYNLAAGGPVLSPRLDAFVVTPIAPHMLGMRPLVLPGTRSITLRLSEAAALTADGRAEGLLAAGDEVRIGPSARRLMLIVDPEQRFYARLRSKLRWGEPPGPG